MACSNLVGAELAEENSDGRLVSALGSNGEERGREMDGRCLRKEEELCAHALRWAEELVVDWGQQAVDRTTGDGQWLCGAQRLEEGGSGGFSKWAGS